MRFWLPIVVFTLTVSASLGQDSDLLVRYLETDGSDQNESAGEKIESLIAKLEAKGSKNDRQFLRNVFTTTHRQLLKDYRQYAGFGEIFDRGQYDCLTATALYSLILTRFGYKHTVVETNYHIFLLVETVDGQILMESTDPVEGFEYQAERIKLRMNSYSSSQNQGNQNPDRPHVFGEVSPEQLTGLLYYNQSVKALNNYQWEKANRLLSLAKRFYYSPRISEMEEVLYRSIASELQRSNFEERALNNSVAQRDQQR